MHQGQSGHPNNSIYRSPALITVFSCRVPTHTHTHIWQMKLTKNASSISSILTGFSTKPRTHLPKSTKTNNQSVKQVKVLMISQLSQPLISDLTVTSCSLTVSSRVSYLILQTLFCIHKPQSSKPFSPARK